MAAVQRIYEVVSKTGAKRLVQAANPAQALRHVAANEYGVQAANALAVAKLMSSGVQLEQARPEGPGGEQLALDGADT